MIDPSRGTVGDVDLGGKPTGAQQREVWGGTSWAGV
jgi:hypothetical protein